MRSALLFTLLLLLSFTGTSFGQKQGKKITITGKVTDANNNPVAGAVIFIDKEKTDQVTDGDGLFRIKVKPAAQEILVFTLINGAGEEKINGRTEIDFKLTGKSAVDPVIIEEAGKESSKTRNKKGDLNDNPKPAATLEMKNSKVPVYQNIYDMIRGRVAGVDVSGNSIRIRGTNSLNVSTEPLFVVDGVIVRSIDDIAPETVKSIEVLKGPDATAYGTRGSNGVILINRKTGKD